VGVQRLGLVGGLVLRVVALIGATALATIPIIVMVETLNSSPVQGKPSGYLPFSSVPSSQTSSAQSLSCGQGGSVLLLLYLHQTDLSDGSLTANVSMCMGQSAARQIKRQGPRTASGVPLLAIAGFGSTFTARLDRIAVAQTSSTNSAAPQPIGSVTIPLEGYPRRYPLDQYQASIGVSISGTCAAMAPTIEVLADPGVGNFDWSSAQPNAGTGSAIAVTKGQQPICSSAAYPVAIAAHRPATTRLFVLALVAIPLLLIVLLSLRLSDGTPRSIDGLVGVTAIMLAILPIRTVLVPGDITSLTLVDFALATEMALLATGTVWWFLLPRRRPAAKSPG
jgi:hypothetical protein